MVNNVSNLFSAKFLSKNFVLILTGSGTESGLIKEQLHTYMYTIVGQQKKINIISVPWLPGKL